MQGNKNDAFKKMYQSGVKASYFGGIQNPKFAQKSKLQISKIQENETQGVDERTFRLMKNFKRPDENFSVMKRTGRCYIEKEGLFSCFSARKHYDIELNNFKLSFLNKDKIARYLDFDAASVTLKPGNDSFTFEIDGTPNQIYVEPLSREKESEGKQMKEWIEALKGSMEKADGQKKKYTYLARHSPDFYKSRHVLHEEFIKSANSGDILLFKSQHSAARLQRVFTDSEYDHVGIVLRNSKNQIFVYESTSSQGVGFTPWSQMINYEWYEQTDKICWRPLYMNLRQKQIDIIEGFVVKTLGKEFELNMDKLFQFKSKLSRTEEEQEKKTYFCSELAARLYKELGLLSEQRSSTMYFPVDFSQKGDLRIIKEGVSLGDERIISFDGIR